MTMMVQQWSHKVSCYASQSSNCFYIGKSQRYVKKQVQEHIGEVTKLYSKLILPNSRPAAHRISLTCHSQSTPTTRTSLNSSGTRTQDSYVLPPTYPPQCVIINNANPPEPTQGLTMQIRRRPRASDISSISNPSQISLIDLITTTDEAPPPHQPLSNNKQEEHCSALAWHLFSHVKHLHLTSKAEVPKWCRKNIKFDII
jgi:hypothetical protein